MIIAVTGGIGAGKSVVCNLLRAMGYSVYDCDSRARAIMDSSTEIHAALAEQISTDVIDSGGNIDRGRLAEIVFNDPQKLAALNTIVHAAVRADLARWIERERGAGDQPLFVETAILYQSGLDRMVDAVWEVIAPEDVRIQRVCRRNGLTPAQVKARIDSQRFEPESLHPHINCITNDESQSVLLQINSLLSID